jgi:hypothetical protein
VRGFVRNNWKSKNFDYENGNPLLEESSEEEDEYEYEDEGLPDKESEIEQ